METNNNIDRQNRWIAEAIESARSAYQLNASCPCDMHAANLREKKSELSLLIKAPLANTWRQQHGVRLRSVRAFIDATTQD